MIKDYRAGLGVDRLADEADMAAFRKLACPTLVLWASLDDLHGDRLSIWQAWADDLRGHEIETGHHMAEEIPEQRAEELRVFLG